MNPEVAARFYKALGDAVRRRRKALGQTQEELAGFIGLSRATVANIETGRQQLLVHQLCQIAEALDLPVEQLLAPVERRLNGSNNDLVLPNDLTPQQRRQVAKLLSKALRQPSTRPQSAGD